MGPQVRLAHAHGLDRMTASGFMASITAYRLLAAQAGARQAPERCLAARTDRRRWSSSAWMSMRWIRSPRIKLPGVWDLTDQLAPRHRTLMAACPRYAGDELVAESRSVACLLGWVTVQSTHALPVCGHSALSRLRINWPAVFRYGGAWLGRGRWGSRLEDALDKFRGEFTCDRGTVSSRPDHLPLLRCGELFPTFRGVSSEETSRAIDLRRVRI